MFRGGPGRSGGDPGRPGDFRGGPGITKGLRGVLGNTHSHAHTHTLARSKFRAQVVIDVANFAKTENGHETGPQGTDFSLDP